MLNLTQLVCRASQGRGRVVGGGLNHSVTFIKPAVLVGPIVDVGTVQYYAYLSLYV